MTKYNLIGDNNYVALDAIHVIISGGSYNSIHSGCEKVTLISSSGCTVMANRKNVTLINTSGITVSDNDVIYQYGKLLSVNSTLVSYTRILSATELNTINSPIELIASPGAGQIIDIISVTGKYTYLGDQHATTGALTIRYNGGDSIASFTLTFIDNETKIEKADFATDVDMIANASVEIYADAPVESGDGNCKIDILYRIIQL